MAGRDTGGRRRGGLCRVLGVIGEWAHLPLGKHVFLAGSFSLVSMLLDFSTKSVNTRVRRVFIGQLLKKSIDKDGRVLSPAYPSPKVNWRTDKTEVTWERVDSGGSEVMREARMRVSLRRCLEGGVWGRARPLKQRRYVCPADHNTEFTRDQDPAWAQRMNPSQRALSFVPQHLIGVPMVSAFSFPHWHFQPPSLILLAKWGRWHRFCMLLELF